MIYFLPKSNDTFLVPMLVLFMAIPRKTEILPHSKILQETNYIEEFSKIWKERLCNTCLQCLISVHLLVYILF